MFIKGMQKVSNSWKSIPLVEEKFVKGLRWEHARTLSDKSHRMQIMKYAEVELIQSYQKNIKFGPYSSACIWNFHGHF